MDPAGRKRSMSKEVELGGGKVKGALAEPSGAAKAGGVVLIQEWFGINAHIKDLVDRFAAAGFVTVAPDLYHGKIATNDDDASKMMNALDFGKAVGEIGTAVSYLKESPRCNGKVAVVGFCMGGALTLASAANLPGLSAVVPFYGLPDLDKTDWSKVTCPILGHFAKRDEWAKPENAETLKKKLEAVGKSIELHLYDAGHAFVRDTDKTKHDPASAKLAWDRTIAFLKKHIG
jgi:carboxymethylenebutenolidase